MDLGGEKLNVINLKFLAVITPVDDGWKLLDRMKSTFIMATNLMINLLVVDRLFLEFMVV